MVQSQQNQKHQQQRCRQASLLQQSIQKKKTTTKQCSPPHFSLFLLLVLGYCSNVVHASYSMVVHSGEEECFIIRAPTKEKSLISGNYDILDDALSPDPISVSLYNSNRNDVWHSKPGISEGTFTITGQGVHQLCIGNGLGGIGGGRRKTIQKPDGNERTVGFAIRVKPLTRGGGGAGGGGDGAQKEGPDDERTANLLAMSSTLMEGLNTMRDHQEYLRDREAKHFALTAQTFHRVMRWTFLEAFVLVVIAGGQVMYLRKFFEQRRYL